MNSRLFLVLAATLAFLGCLTSSALAQSPPLNDDFANRRPLTGDSVTFVGTLAGATLESVETNSLTGLFARNGSVWWTWTAPISSMVVIATLSNASVNSNVWLDVYAGTTLAQLTGLDANALSYPFGRYVIFQATAGTSYQFRVSGASGAQAGTFVLKLTATNSPIFVIQPQDCTVSPHGSAFFSSIASGPPPINFHSASSYQWKFNGTPIAGQTAPSLIVYDVSSNQAGLYSVIASNSGGIMESATAVLTIVDTNPLPRLAALSPASPSLVSFSLTGESGRWYQIESSQDLGNWGSPVWLQLPAESIPVSVPRLGPNHFVRAALSGSTDACVAQLKQMRWGAYMYAIEQRLSRQSFSTFQTIKTYVPVDACCGNMRGCPEGAYYTLGSTILDNPKCMLQSRGHVIGD